MSDPPTINKPELKSIVHGFYTLKEYPEVKLKQFLVESVVFPFITKPYPVENDYVIVPSVRLCALPAK